jgi:hypothetical protein
MHLAAAPAAAHQGHQASLPRTNPCYVHLTSLKSWLHPSPKSSQPRGMSVTIAAKISPWRLEGAAKISAALLPPRYSSARGARSTTAEATDTMATTWLSRPGCPLIMATTTHNPVPKSIQPRITANGSSTSCQQIHFRSRCYRGRPGPAMGMRATLVALHASRSSAPPFVELTMPPPPAASRRHRRRQLLAGRATPSTPVAARCSSHPDRPTTSASSPNRSVPIAAWPGRGASYAGSSLRSSKAQIRATSSRHWRGTCSPEREAVLIVESEPADWRG